MGNVERQLLISIDIAASTDKTHTMSVAIESLKKMIRKRRNSCVLFAQVANTESARRFWQGKLTKTKRASIMTALFSEFDPRYLVYEDVTDTWRSSTSKAAMEKRAPRVCAHTIVFHNRETFENKCL